MNNTERHMIQQGELVLYTGLYRPPDAPRVVQDYRDKLMAGYNIKVPACRDRIRALAAGRAAVVGIVGNKRYSDRERCEINAFIAEQSGKQLGGHKMDLRWIDWAEDKSMGQQMARLAEFDVYVSGPGTGMMYTPFQRDGAAHVNLGAVVPCPAR